MLRHIITLTLTNDPPLTLRTTYHYSFSLSLSLSLFIFLLLAVSRSVYSRLARLLLQGSLHPSISSLAGSNPRHFDSRGLQPPSPRFVGPHRGQYRRPCTLDTLRLRCLITQDTSSRGDRACYRAAPFSSSPFFLLYPCAQTTHTQRTSHRRC